MSTQEMTDRARRQVHDTLADAAIALKAQERVVRQLMQADVIGTGPAAQEARTALKRLRGLTHNTLIRIRTVQMTLLGVTVDVTENHTAGAHSDHENRSTT